MKKDWRENLKKPEKKPEVWQAHNEISLSNSASQTKQTAQQWQLCWHGVLDCITTTLTERETRSKCLWASCFSSWWQFAPWLCTPASIRFTTEIWLYLYCDERRDIQWNLAWARGISRGLRLYFIVYPDSIHNTDILNYKSSIDIPGRSILEELILCIASTTGQYGKILPRKLRNIGVLECLLIENASYSSLKYI